MSNMSDETMRAHYDAEYRSGRYTTRDPRADALDDYHVGLVAAVLGMRPGERVLDLGSGVGHYVRAWQRGGFDSYGIELSPVAVELAKSIDVYGHRVSVGDACNLDFPPDSFRLVFSSMLLEHIELPRVRGLLTQALRIAPITAHFVAHEAGTDPGHINIRSPLQWSLWLKDVVKASAIVPNPLFPQVPMILCFRDDSDVSVALRAASADASQM